MLLFNYCTWGYSFATWSEKNWEEYIPYLKEKFASYNYTGTIRPLLLPGMEAVWFDLLTEDYGFSEADALDFIPGPAYTPWWLMSNLYGSQVTKAYSVDWIERQRKYGKWLWNKFIEAGWEPILPGWNGMVPVTFTKYSANATVYDLGKWNNFSRPYMLDPTSNEYREFAAKYYNRLEKQFGKLDGDQYYSIDLFHEGGVVPNGISAPHVWRCTYGYLNKYNNNAILVIQAWDLTNEQKTVFDNIPKGKLLIIDMVADTAPNVDNFKRHNTVFGIIPNFGGRTGFISKINSVKENYNKYKEKYVDVGWIVESIPDRLDDPNYASLNNLICLSTGIEYTHSEFKDILWNGVYKYLLNCSTSQQGPTEAIACCTVAGTNYGSSPTYTVLGSQWGTTEYYYNIDLVNKNIFDIYLNHKDELTPIELKDIITILINNLFYIWNTINTDNTVQTSWLNSIRIYLDCLERLQSLDYNTCYYKFLYNIKQFSKDDDEAKWLFANNVLRLNTLWYDDTSASSGQLLNYAYKEFGWLLKHIYKENWQYIIDTQQSNKDSSINQITEFICTFEFEHYTDLTFVEKSNKQILNELNRILDDVIGSVSTITSNNNEYYKIALTESTGVDTAKPVAYNIPYYIIGTNSQKEIGINNSDASTVKDYSQYLNTLSINNTDISTNLINLYNSSTIINQDLISNKTITVKSASSGLNICVITVALLGLESGKLYYKESFGAAKSDNNSFLNNFSQTINIPSDAADKNFRLIYRIDSSYATTLDSTGKLIDLYSDCTRPIYDITLICDKSASTTPYILYKPTYVLGFIDNTGKVFSFDNYQDSTGYELLQNKYIFWVDNPVTDFDLSINTYYIKQITPYITNDALDISSVKSIKIELASNKFSLIKYSDIKADSALTIDLNNISNLKEITYNSNEFIIDETSKDLIAPFFVLTKSSEEGTYSTNALITVTFRNDDQVQTIYNVITIGGTFISEDEKFSINVNNMGFTIPKSIINAVYQGELQLENYQGNYNNFDFSLYNAKLREYLLYNKNLKNNKGNYNSIKSHLDWFGWGTDLTLTKLLKTDNQFLTQYLDRDYIANNDNNVLINHFVHTALINVRLSQNEILYDYNNNIKEIQFEDQDWDSTDLIGEGAVKTSDLFDKYVPVNLEENSNFQYIEPFYRYSLNTILIKLAFLKYYYKKYFLPVHVDTLSVDVNERCFIPDIKLYTSVKSGFTVPMLLNSDNNYVIIGDTSETVFLTKKTCYTNDCFIEFEGYTEHENLELIANSDSENLYEVKEMHAKIPLRFYKDIEEYLNIGSIEEDEDYIYNINIILSKYNKDLNRYTSIYSKTKTFTKNLAGNTDGFIIIPNINGTNHDATWYEEYDNLYKLDVYSNGSWFSKVFKVKFPPVNFNLGYLKYTYQTEEELKKGISPFSTSLGESFMREPKLVTLDNIKFVKDTIYDVYIDNDNTSNDYINLYKDNYNIPNRESNPELYNIVMYFEFDYLDSNDFTSTNDYDTALRKFKQSLSGIVADLFIYADYDFKKHFDFYIMYQPKESEITKSIPDNTDKVYIVLISKQTSTAECFDNFEQNISDLKDANDSYDDYNIRFITAEYRFLINRYSVIPYTDNIIDPNKLLTCSASSVYDFNVPFNLDNGLKWNFTPYSLVNNQAFNVTSKADIAIVSIPKHNQKVPSGYYNIFLNYSLNGYDTVSIKAPYKVLFK